MISVLILTKNEEQDLPACLASVAWSEDIHVFDSYSEDKTVEIAEQFGAKVSQRIFDNYANQRNAALTSIPFQYEWIFILDADEQVPDVLRKEIETKIGRLKEDVNGIRIRRKDFLGKTWLKYAQLSPYYIRLVKKGKAQYHREINEVIEVEGEVEQFNTYFNHYPFSKGYSHWLSKHNLYSSMEANRWIEEHKGQFHFSLSKALFSRDFSERRYHQKGIFYQLPGRPIIKFLYMVLVRRAFLDGRAGITYALLQSIYEYFIVLKTRELLANKH